MKLFSWLRITAKEEKKDNFPSLASSRLTLLRDERKPPSWKEFPSPRKDERGKTSWCSLLGHVTEDLLRFHPTHSSEAETYRDGTGKGKKNPGLQRAAKGWQWLQFRDLLYRQTKPLVPPQKEPRDLTAAADAPEISAGTVVHSYSCSQMPAASVPVPSPLQSAQGAVQAGSLDGPPTADTTAAGTLQASSSSGVLARCCPAPITSLHCPEGSNAHGRRCQQLGSLQPLACGPESSPVFSVTGLHNPAPQEPAPVAAYWHVPSLTLDTILHRRVYTQGEIVQPWESTPTARVPEAAGEPAADPGPCFLSALYTHRDLSWPCSRVFVPHQSRPPPPPVLASGCWTWRCSWRPQQPLGKPCSVCWGSHRCWILVTRAEAVTAPESRAARCPCVWCPEPLEKSHGQRSLVGYSPWSHKGSDMTDWLSSQTPIMCQSLILVLGLQTWDLQTEAG